MIALKKWADGFSGCLALSSGNHDGNLEDWAVAGELTEVKNRAEALTILSLTHWMDVLDRPAVSTSKSPFDQGRENVTQGTAPSRIQSYLGLSVFVPTCHS
jgi:hypothetical protein